MKNAYYAALRRKDRREKQEGEGLVAVDSATNLAASVLTALPFVKSEPVRRSGGREGRKRGRGDEEAAEVQDECHPGAELLLLSAVVDKEVEAYRQAALSDSTASGDSEDSV